MNWESAISAVMLLAAAVTSSAQKPAASKEDAPLHTRSEFNFTVEAPFDQVAPLFGAHEERKWAAHWNPQFIYPTPARDQPGMVFKVAHGQFTSVWVNTALDIATGHIQYTYVLNDAMAVLIDIHPPERNACIFGSECPERPAAGLLTGVGSWRRAAQVFGRSR